MFKKSKKLFLILVYILLLSSCGKSGEKNVDKINNELKNSTNQFSLNSEEISLLEKPYSEFTDDDKKLFDKILVKYNEFKNNSSEDIAFERKILKKLEEIESFYDKKYINFKNESSKEVKVEEKLLQQNSKIELSKKDFNYNNYLIKITGKGIFSYYIDNTKIVEEVLAENEKPRYVRINITKNSNIEFNGNIIGIIFKDNINYNKFQNLPSGIFSINEDIAQGNYKITNTTVNTIIKTISKENKIEVINLKETHNIKLEKGMKLIISNVDYITLEKAD